MFGINKKDPFRPRKLDAFLSRKVAEEWQNMPSESDHWVTFMVVEKIREDNPDEVDVLIYDQWIADHQNFKIVNFDSLEAHPELVLFEGRYNKKAKQVDLRYRKAA